MEQVHALRSEDFPPAQLRRRQKIVDAAKELLISEGYDTVQIREIAARAEVALGTVYRYFSSKEHIYAVVLQIWADPFYESPPEQTVGIGSLDRARFRLRRVVAAFVRNPSFIKVQMMVSISTDPNVLAIRTQLGDAMNAQLVKDLSVIPERRARDITIIAWCITTQLINDVSASIMPLEEAIRLLDEYFILVERSSTAAF